MAYNNTKNVPDVFNTENKPKNSNDSITQNTNIHYELHFIFSSQTLSMADKKELIKLEYLANELPYKYYREQIHKEYKRRRI